MKTGRYLSICLGCFLVTSLDAQIFGPAYTVCGGPNVLIGATGCLNLLPLNGRLQVTSGTGSVFNYAGEFFAPPAPTKQNYGLRSSSGTAGTNSGLSTTGGEFQAWGGLNYITGCAASAVCDVPGFVPGGVVTGLSAVATTNKSGALVFGTNSGAYSNSGGALSTLAGVVSTCGGGGGGVSYGYGLLNALSAGPTYANAYGISNTISAGVSTINLYGLHSRIQAVTASAVMYGVQSQIDAGSTTPIAYGMHSLVSSGTNRFGIRSEVTNVGSAPGQTWYGVYGKVGDPGLSPPSTINAYAVYGTANSYPPTGGVSLTGSNTNSYAGWFNGHVWVNNLFGASDARIKTNVAPIEGSMQKLMKLSPKNYQFNHAIHPSMNLPHGTQFGLIAQDLEKIVPELVTNTIVPDQFEGDKLIEKGFDLKGVNYLGLIPIIIAGVQEQQREIAEQKAVIAEKEAQIDALIARIQMIEQSLGLPAHGSSLDPTKARLEQNVPNPFDETTVIRYYVPVGSGTAFLQFVGADGKVVRRFDGLSSGQGELLIGAGALAFGSYNYTLYVDNSAVDTKTMVITR